MQVLVKYAYYTQYMKSASSSDPQVGLSQRLLIKTCCAPLCRAVKDIVSG